MICQPADERLTGSDDPVPCCYGWSVRESCTCWSPGYDLRQAAPDEVAESEIRTTRCGDCAYRPGSAELAVGDVMSLSITEVFHCHQGMRRVVAWRHPDGREVPGEPDEYSPPIAGGRPFQADGRPAVICAGWAEMHTNPSPDWSPS